MSELWHPERSRKITQRIIVTCDLVLETPAHFGNGDGDTSLMPLLVSPHDGRSPLLTGASIAGALRSYLGRFVNGNDEKIQFIVNLFGIEREDEKEDSLSTENIEQVKEQSRLIIDDSLGETSAYELRDGVHIQAESRTAEDGGLYTFQVWAAGTRFPLRFELLIYETDDDKRISQMARALATAIQGFADGRICIGGRKRRGYGRTRLENIATTLYELTKPDQMLQWLRGTGIANPVESLDGAWDIKLLEQKETEFRLKAHFTLEGSLLIRAFSEVSDMRHLHSRTANKPDEPILTGTSIAGAIRARAARILCALNPKLDAKDVEATLRAMFGGEIEEKLRGSRLSIDEHPIALQNGQPQWVQNRVSIDRFTGGALDTALFSQEPVFGSQEKGIEISLSLRRPQPHEMGLLLLILKDLWTGDLALGGESSVGRGRLRGEHAEISYAGNSWEISRELDNRLTIPAEARPQFDTWVRACKEIDDAKA